MEPKTRWAIFRVYFVTFLIAFLLTAVLLGKEAASRFPLVGLIASNNYNIATPFGYLLLALLASVGIIARSFIPYAFFLAILILQALFWIYVGSSFKHM
ncbi:MAG TPA: hypothetical protein VN317_01525 [Candidatus Methanoperedens sp.]|nr:hypothetical protein [Candidatus Methanoperedens sp.]